MWELHLRLLLTTTQDLGVGLRNNVISNIKGALNGRFLSGYTYSFAFVETDLHSSFS